jgi:hypothetical protein
MRAPLGTIERLLAEEGTAFIRGLLQSPPSRSFVVALALARAAEPQLVARRAQACQAQRRPCAPPGAAGAARGRPRAAPPPRSRRSTPI